MAGLVGKKLGMTRFFKEDGTNISVTLIEAKPCVVTQIKTLEKDGYEAVQIGYELRKESKSKKAQLGLFKKANTEPRKHLAEFRGKILLKNGDEEKPVEVGDELKVDQFVEGEKVNLSGKSKGKGFAGVVKRHGFAGGPKTHGQTDMERSSGSVGASSYPSRVFKGMRMGGRMGGDKRTLKNISIIQVDVEKNLIAIEGPVPGAINSFVKIWN